MSIQLLLSHYLAGLRERDELDAILPDLLREMGHSVLSRAQVGVDQGGVDVVTTALNGSGIKEVFLFIIKFGNLGKQDLVGGPQSIDPSIRRAASEFVRNRLPDDCSPLHKRIVLLTNGCIKQEAQAGYAALTKDVAEQYSSCSLEFWGIDQLSPLIETQFFNEGLLLEQGKSDLRAALAGIEQTEPSIERFARFIDACMKVPDSELTLHEESRKRSFLKRCASVSMGWAVLLGWGQSESNLKPGVLAGELLLTRIWAEAVLQGFHSDRAFVARMNSIMEVLAGAFKIYFEKVSPVLIWQRELVQYRPHPILYNLLVLEELGRLAIFLLVLQRMPETEAVRREFSELLKKLIKTHASCTLPVLDGHSIDLSLIILALMGQQEYEFAQGVISESTQRFAAGARANRFLPVDSDIVEDAINLNELVVNAEREFFKTSTLAPMLGTFAAFLDCQESINLLNQDLMPHLKGVTLERWFPSVEMETMAATKMPVTEIGTSRGVDGICATVAAEAAESVRHIEGVAAPSDFKWYNTPFEVLVAISSHVHRHPLPTWFVDLYRVVPKSSVSSSVGCS